MTDHLLSDGRDDGKVECPRCAGEGSIYPEQLPSKDLSKSQQKRIAIQRGPSKGRGAEPQFLRAYAVYLRKPHDVRENGLRQPYLDALADDLEAAAAEIETLSGKLDTCGLQCSATLESLVAENERLKGELGVVQDSHKWLFNEKKRLETTLTGISTCSTCEACRGAALRALGGEPASAWQPIETAPKRIDAIFWIRAGTKEDGRWYCNTDGDPILSSEPARIHVGQYGTWSSLMVATHWMPLPAGPSQPPGDGQ